MAATQVLPRRVAMRKDANGFGFNLGKSGGAHFLRKVDDGGVAGAAGALTGDRILAVNDLSVVHKNHAELVQFIKAGGGKLSMVLLASAQQMPIPHTAYPISVTRGPDGFGFNLGRKGNVHYFKGVDAGSAALAAGASLNALIFEVNSVGVSGLTHSDVVKLIKAGGTTVVFKILQDGGQYVQQATMAEAERTAARGRQAASEEAQRLQQAALEEAQRLQQAALEEAQRLQAVMAKLLAEEQELEQSKLTAESELRKKTTSLFAQQEATARIALPVELDELNQALAPIEIKAIEEANARTEAIYMQAAQGKHEPATVEIRESIAELMAELEMTLTQQKLIELRQQELERLAVLAKRRRKFESFDGGSEEHAQHRGRRLMDLASLQERKARFEAVVSDAHEHSNAVKAQQAEEHEEAERIRAAEDELLRKLAAHRAETIVAQRALEDRCTNARREPLAFFNKIDTTRNGRMSREDFQRPGAREHIARFMKDRIEIYDLTVDELIEEVADKPYLAFLKAVNRPVTEEEVQKKVRKLKRGEDALTDKDALTDTHF